MKRGITPREAQVLDLLTYGKTNKEIADALGVTDRTVSVHVRNLQEATGCANRTALVGWAFRTGLAA